MDRKEIGEAIGYRNAVLIDATITARNVRCSDEDRLPLLEEVITKYINHVNKRKTK